MYDRVDAYEKNIKKRAKELNEMCKQYGISSFMSFCVKDNGKTCDYHNFICGSVSNGIHLSDDQITKHVNVANGFLTVPDDGRSSEDD